MISSLLSTHLISQVDKVVQMYETMLTRHTTMVVGPTGGGKSVVINTLAQAQTRWVNDWTKHKDETVTLVKKSILFNIKNVWQYLRVCWDTFCSCFPSAAIIKCDEEGLQWICYTFANLALTTGWISFLWLQVGNTHKDIYHEPQGHERHRAVWHFRPGHSRLDGRTPLQHLQRNQQAHGQERTKVHPLRRRRRCAVGGEHEFSHGRQQALDPG